MKKLDLKKEYRELYVPSARKIAVVKVPRLQFLMIDGEWHRARSPARRLPLKAR